MAKREPEVAAPALTAVGVAGGPVTLGAPWGDAVMGAAARLMGNLVTDDDRDLTARLWRAAGRASLALDSRGPWS